MRIRTFLFSLLISAAASTAASAGDSTAQAPASKDELPTISCTLVECHTAAEWAAINKKRAATHDGEQKDAKTNKQASASGN